MKKQLKLGKGILKALSMHHQWISGFLCRNIVQARCTIASPQTSFGVRWSRIHFSPTEEKWMRDERTPEDVCGGARIWSILLQLWSPSFCAPRLEYSSSRAYYLLYSFHFYHFLPLYICFSRYLDCKIRSTIEFFSEKKGVYVWSSWLYDNWLYLKMKFSIRHSIWLEINSPWLFANFPLHSPSTLQTVICHS